MENPNNNKSINERHPAISSVLFMEIQGMCYGRGSWEHGFSLMECLSKTSRKSKKKRREYLEAQAYEDGVKELAKTALEWFQN